MPFDAAIIDPATHMAGWAPNDFWNQQMQKFVDAEVAKVQKSVDSNRREGIVPRSKLGPINDQWLRGVLASFGHCRLHRRARPTSPCGVTGHGGGITQKTRNY